MPTFVHHRMTIFWTHEFLCFWHLWIFVNLKGIEGWRYDIIISISNSTQQTISHISPGQKWWLIVFEIKVSCNQWECSTCPHEVPSFFLWKGGKIFRFPNVFPSGSQVIPQDVPNTNLILSHMICPKLNSHVYINWKGEHMCFYFATWGPKTWSFYWEVPNISNKIGDGLINMALSPKKNKIKIKMWAHPTN